MGSQVIETPHSFVDQAAAQILGARSFLMDLAAEPHTTKCHLFVTKEDDLFSRPLSEWIEDVPPYALQTFWLNPPFGSIGKFVAYCAEHKAVGDIVALVLASTCSVWWNQIAKPHADIYRLKRRITFVGHPHQFTRELALLHFWKLSGGKDCWIDNNPNGDWTQAHG